MELKATIELMQSADYKDRFKAEYYQTKTRYDNLHKMLIMYEAGTLTFEPKCSLEMLTEQAAHMGRYLKCLEVRAEIEGIELISECKKHNEAEPMKHGEWKTKGFWIVCSNCHGALIRDNIMGATVYPHGLPEYCPLCGVKMEVGEDNDKT